MFKATPYEQSLNDDHTNFGWCKIFEAFHIQKIGPDFKSHNRQYCHFSPTSRTFSGIFCQRRDHLERERDIIYVLLIMFVIEYLNLI